MGGLKADGSLQPERGVAAARAYRRWMLTRQPAAGA
jgi:hypothetical protein